MFGLLTGLGSGALLLLGPIAMSKRFYSDGPTDEVWRRAEKLSSYWPVALVVTVAGGIGLFLESR
jgi:uncharacterized membrane protein